MLTDIASIISALAAAASVWFAYKTVITSERTLDEQQRIRAFERSEQQYDQQITLPVREYLTALSTTWYDVFQDGLTKLDALIANKASNTEQAAFVQGLTFSLRETWRRASFNLMVGAESWDRSLLWELDRARDTLEEKVSEILNARMSKSLLGRNTVQRSLAVTIRGHSVSVLECIAKHAPKLRG